MPSSSSLMTLRCPCFSDTIPLSSCRDSIRSPSCTLLRILGQHGIGQPKASLLPFRTPPSPQNAAPARRECPVWLEG